MVGKPKVTLRAQWLGHMLRELREENALTLKEAGDHIGRSISTISRYESGTWPIAMGELDSLMNLYGVASPSQRAQMTQLADELTETGWWDRYAKDMGQVVNLLWLEDRAERLRLFAPLLVPGLLQTRGYAESLIRAYDADAPTSQIERWIGIRMARQAILRREHPPTVQVVLDEAALRRPVGGREVMRNQLRHLRQCAEHGTIDIRVLPFSAGEYPGTDGSFRLVKLPDPFPEVVHIESVGGPIHVESHDVLECAGRFDRMVAECCLDEDASAAFILDVERDIYAL